MKLNKVYLVSLGFGILSSTWANARVASDPVCVSIWSDLKVQVQLFQQLGGTLDQLNQSLEESYTLWSKKIPELKSANDRLSAGKFLENSAQATREAREQNKAVLNQMTQDLEILSRRFEDCMAGKEERDFFPQSVMVQRFGPEGVNLVLEGFSSILNCSGLEIEPALGAIEGDVQVVQFKAKMRNCNETAWKMYFQREVLVRPAPGINKLHIYIDEGQWMYFEVSISSKN